MKITSYISTAATKAAIEEITRRDGRAYSADQIERRVWAARAFIESAGMSVLDADSYMDITLAMFRSADFMPPEMQGDMMQFANDIILLRRCAAQLLQQPPQEAA